MCHVWEDAVDLDSLKPDPKPAFLVNPNPDSYEGFDGKSFKRSHSRRMLVNKGFSLIFLNFMIKNIFILRSDKTVVIDHPISWVFGWKCHVWMDAG
jgi:hypothetical protein